MVYVYFVFLCLNSGTSHEPEDSRCDRSHCWRGVGGVSCPDRFLSDLHTKQPWRYVQSRPDLSKQGRLYIKFQLIQYVLNADTTSLKKNIFYQSIFLPVSLSGVQLEIRIPGNITTCTISGLEAGMEYNINVFAVINNSISVPASITVSTCKCSLTNCSYGSPKGYSTEAAFGPWPT